MPSVPDSAPLDETPEDDQVAPEALDVTALPVPNGDSYDAVVERINNLGPSSKIRFRLSDGQALLADLPNNLLPVLTAERNVELPLLLTHLSKAERRKHVEAALGIVGLSHRARHYPRTLSGGEQQRTGIARAIVTDPTILLCDEPTGDLDRKSGDEILGLLQGLNKEQGKTIIMVTHDPHASARAQRIVYLDKGRLFKEKPE